MFQIVTAFSTTEEKIEVTACNLREVNISAKLLSFLPHLKEDNIHAHRLLGECELGKEDN